MVLLYIGSAKHIQNLLIMLVYLMQNLWPLSCSPLLLASDGTLLDPTLYCGVAWLVLCNIAL